MLIGVVAQVVVGRAWLQSPEDVARFLREMIGGTSPLAFVVAGAILPCLFVPTPLIMAAAGAAFGVVGGTPIAVLPIAASAVIQVGIGRRIPGNYIAADGSDGWQARVVSLSASRGWLSVVAVRLTPGVPFTFANYALGATPVRLTSVGVGSAVGLVPRTIVYVGLGASLGDASLSGATWALIGVCTISLAGALLSTYLWRFALRSSLRTATPKAD